LEEFFSSNFALHTTARLWLVRELKVVNFRLIT
jgi:hypothetical protein